MLVVLRALNMDRITEGFLRGALDAGHTVHVALEHRKVGPTTEGNSLFDVLASEYPGFSYDGVPPRDEPWLHPATRLRCAIDYLRYFEPEFARAETLRRRAAGRAPWYVRIPGALRLLRLGPLRRAFNRFLRGVERRLPVSQASLAMIRSFEPDVVVVSPLVETGSAQGDHLRAADRLGITTVLLVSSWDNLTTKGVIRDAPDLTIVWNDEQVREAIDLHGLPAGSVVATGAHSHDHWFAWAPATEAGEFAERVGVSPERPLLLYTCSSGFIAGGDEVEFVREWADRLAASGDPELEAAGIVVRPHPQNFGSWQEADVDEPGRIVVWPRGGVAPTDHRSKEDYFDSLYHAKAVVGLNTSALVDSAIVRRPVFTILHERFRGTQTGTLHFGYLATGNGDGLLNVAESWAEHFEQLGAALRAPERHRERIERFLRSFIRPHGLDRPAAPIAIEAVERAVAEPKERAGEGGLLRWLVGAIASGLGRLHQLRERLQPRNLRRRLAKRRRRRARMKRKRGQVQRRTRAAKPAKARERADRERAGAPR
jgi:hypothetical protein